MKLDILARAQIFGMAAVLAVSCGLQAAAANRAVLIGGRSDRVDGALDANRFAQALLANRSFAADEISMLTGEALTRNRVLMKLTTDLQRETEPGDLVVIYFSGLGGQRPGADTNDEPDGLDEVLILDDASGESILDNELEAAINALVGRRVSVFLDTGFAPGKETARFQGFRGAGRIGPLVEKALVSAVEGGTFAALGGLPDLPTEPTEIVSKVLDSAGIDLPEPGPLTTKNPTAEIWSASTPESSAFNDTSGGAFTSTLVKAMETGDADQNNSGGVSSTEFLAFSRQSLAELCSVWAYCETTSRPVTPSRVIADDRFASLDPSNGPGNIVPDGLPAEGTGAFSESLGVAIPTMAFEERLSFVSDRFGSINRANVMLKIAPGQRMRVGDIVKFELTADRDGNFILIDVDPLGRVVQVYPSPLSPKTSTSVAAGTPVTIPSVLSKNGMPLRIRVTPPQGQGLLMAVFVEGDITEIDALLPEDIAGTPVQDGFGFLYKLADSLLGMTASVGPAPQIWSTQYVEYEIFP